MLTLVNFKRICPKAMVWQSRTSINTIEEILRMVFFMEWASNMDQIMNSKENSRVENAKKAYLKTITLNIMVNFLKILLMERER
jgi:hypothetical protein